ncbi:hypothetical protein [Actinophytocola sp.]|uniref:hypothetical protein n=1 Tax=Actinophytocola sp. TaxID=1872138 RepID=UPI002ED08B22
MMLRARRRGMFKRQYEITSADEALTSLIGGRRESCEFSLSDTDFRIERDGRKRFLLHSPDGRVATAERQTGREWAIKATTGNLKLVKPSIWRSGWEVRQRGTRKGEIRHDGAFKRTYTADMPADVPPPVAVFALYVVLVIFERAAAAAAGG